MMKLSAYLIIFSLFLSHCLSVSDVVSEACMKAARFDDGLSYDFCVSYLSNWQPPTSNVEDYWVNSIQLLKTNGTSMISLISKVLNDNNNNFDQRAKDALKGCSDSYKETLSELDAAVVAFKAKDLDTAATKVSESLDTPIICQLSFNGNGTPSPLTAQNNAYFQLNVIPLVLIQILNNHSS